MMREKKEGEAAAGEDLAPWSGRHLVFYTWSAVILYLYLQPPSGTPGPLKQLAVLEIARRGVWLAPLIVFAPFLLSRLLPRAARIAVFTGRDLAWAAVGWVVPQVVLQLYLPDNISLAPVLAIQATAAHLLLYARGGAGDRLPGLLPATWPEAGRQAAAALVLAGVALPILSAIVLAGTRMAPAWFHGLAFASTLPVRNDVVELGLAIVAVPLCEEILFRAGLCGGLSARIGRWPAIIISALIFAALHANPGIMWARGIAGFFLGWLYLRTGTLVGPLALHALMNAAIMLLPILFGRPS